ncbi:MAG: hypothetical protein ACE15F_24765 [bacterium]
MTDRPDRLDCSSPPAFTREQAAEYWYGWRELPSIPRLAELTQLPNGYLLEVDESTGWIMSVWRMERIE